MFAIDVRTAAPTAAERVRSVLVAAGSLTVTARGSRCALTGLHTTDEQGRLRVRPPADCWLAAEAAGAPRGMAALLEFTDVAPTAVRDRVRARVTLSGQLTPCDPPSAAGGTALRMDPSLITLETAAGSADVTADDLALAAPDPLAAGEAGLLTHMSDAHLDAVGRLTRLVDSRHLHGVLRVLPVALDRYGLTLRLEHARTHRDIRLPFPVPLRDAGEVGGRVQALLAAAQACPRRRRARP